jgi:hypothetical protein
LLRHAVILSAALTLPACGGSSACDRSPSRFVTVADGTIQVDPDFERGPTPFHGAVLIDRPEAEPGAQEPRLDFAYLENAR